jgi:hypothetical protein
MSVRLPRYLHLPVQLLWFDMEDLAVLGVCYLMWLLFSSWLVAPLIVVGPWLFMRIKARRPRGFLRHQLYQYGFARLAGYPPPLTGRFEE